MYLNKNLLESEIPDFPLDEEMVVVSGVGFITPHYNGNEIKKEDLVNSPNHYTSGGIETIKFIKAKLTKEEFIGYMKGNIIKYISRASLKNGNEDYAKASVYMNWLVEENLIG